MLSAENTDRKIAGKLADLELSKLVAIAQIGGRQVNDRAAVMVASAK